MSSPRFSPYSKGPFSRSEQPGMMSADAMKVLRTRGASEGSIGDGMLI